MKSENVRNAAFLGVKKKSTARKPFVSAALRTAQVALFAAVSVLAQEPSDFNSWESLAEDFDRFQFFNACEGMSHYVRITGEGRHDSAPSKAEIANAIESRLRASRVYEDDLDTTRKSYFNLYLNFAGSAASLRVGFEKPGFVDPYSKHRSATSPRGMETWQKNWVVQGAYDSGDILAQVSKYLDEFLVNYLRVNSEEACSKYQMAEQKHKAEPEAERKESGRSRLHDDIFERIDAEFAKEQE